MPIRKYKPEQIVTVLRQIEVQMANGKTAPQACKEAGIHTQTYYRWRKEYGGLKVVQAKRLQELKASRSQPRREDPLWRGRLPQPELGGTPAVIKVHKNPCTTSGAKSPIMLRPA
jgi:hypothetical protein